ncbi:MAG: autotransporter assembly complex family protein [Gammaproteobacteria bacterium]
MKLPTRARNGFFALAGLCLGLCAAPLAVADLRVEVQGLDDALRANVLSLLTVQRERARTGLSEGHVRRYFQRAPREIRQALEPFGYYDPRIDSDLRRVGDDWIAEFRIEPGEPVRFSAPDLRITGAGAADPALRKALVGLDIRAGEPALHPRYEAARARLQAAALERGYLDAAYSRRELRIDTVQRTAEVVLHLDTGPQFRFGEVSFSHAGLDEALVRRYLGFEPGDVYSTGQLLDLQRALEDSDYFARVEVVPLRDQAEDHAVPVQVTLEPRKRHKYTAGLGFGTDTGARGLLGWEHRRINRHGHRMQAEIRASEIRQGLTANYSLPLANPRSDRLDFSAAAQDEQTDSVDSSLYKLAVGRSQARGRWREVLSLGYQREDYVVGLTHETTTLLIPGISYAQVRADNRLVATRGHSLHLELRGAAEPLLSDISFVQTEVKAKLIRPLGDNGRVIARAEGGTTWVDGFRELPASLRYFAGGDQSVRGYDYQELGPRDASGAVIGGKHRVFGSLEYEHRVRGNWGVAAFVDTGNAFNSTHEGLETGAGLGLRWRSPIGMLRLDLAAAVSRDNALRLHFTLGPDL